MGIIPDDWEGRAAWLKTQAALVYRFNIELDYFEVRNRWHFEGHQPFIPTPLTERLKDSFQYAATWYKRQPSLLHQTPSGLKTHRTIDKWSRLSSEAKKRISDFFSDHGLHNFDYFDHGGWGIVFKAQDRETGRNRIARIGTDLTKDRWRPVNEAVLPLYADNYSDLTRYEDLKLEIMAEVVPLMKFPSRPSVTSNTALSEFLNAAKEITMGTNLLYPDDWFDEDCDPANAGVLPDGKVVSFDPLFKRGEIGLKRRNTSWDFTEEHKTFADRLYGLDPAARFF